MNLRIPGPTPLPPAVMAALQKPMIDHRSAEFSALLRRCVAGLKMIAQTNGDVLLLSCSGTGGLESAVVNTLSPGDRVVACVAGVFGVRFAEIARDFGAQVEPLVFEPGAPVEPERLGVALKQFPDARAVLFTHNETSTGVLHRLREIAAVVRAQSDALLLVDAVSSFGATEINMDTWGADVVITGSQKALMSPPGLAIIAAGERALRAAANARMSRSYFAWRPYQQRLAEGFTPYTPALPVFFALDAALQLIDSEGLANVYARHRRVAQFTRDGAQEIGFALLADERDASPTVTAIKVPAGVDGDEIRRRAREMGVTFGGGLGDLHGKLIRIGHMGFVHEPELNDALGVLREASAPALAHA